MNKLPQYFLSIFLPWGIALFAFFTYFYLSQAEKINSLLLESETLNVQMGKRAIHQEFHAVMSDLLIMAEHNILQDDQRLLSIEAYKNMQHDFILFSKMKGIYDQVRFLNTDGQEIIRVNYSQGKVTPVPVKLLQNKGNRGYFLKSLQTNRAMIYVSPLDLNIEHGEIELPHKPVIRFGTPLFNKMGEKTGVLILNYLAQRLLDNFSSAVANIDDHISILNQEGYWLKSPHPDMEWGFMLNSENNIINSHPEAWKMIHPEESGQFSSKEGIFTFTTIYLFQALQMHNEQGEKEKKYSMNDEYQWKIVSHITPEIINADKRSRQVTLFKIAIPIFLLLMLLSWGLSIAKIKNKQAKELLQLQATIDTLTGLPNRQLYHDRLSRCLLHSKRLNTKFALLFIDLDRFKTVNDTLGHAAGDQLLQQVAEKLRHIIRESDTVARIGGDEFTIILNSISKSSDITRVAELITEKLSEPFPLDTAKVNIGASIGIAIYPQDGMTKTTLMQNADSAMYLAKKSGRNRYYFFE